MAALMAASSVFQRSSWKLDHDTPIIGPCAIAAPVMRVESAAMAPAETSFVLSVMFSSVMGIVCLPCWIAAGMWRNLVDARTLRGLQSLLQYMLSRMMISMRIFSWAGWMARSEEHTSELQSLMRISYAVFCL